MDPDSDHGDTTIRIQKEILSHHLSVRRTRTSISSMTVSRDTDEWINGELRGEDMRYGVDGARVVLK